jgi:hypothetical protein
MGLCDQEIGSELQQQRFVDLVKRLAGAQARPHQLVDLAAAAANVERGAAYFGQFTHPRRVVAFVRAPDELVAQAEGAQQLGAAG